MSDPIRLRDEGGAAKDMLDRIASIEPPAGSEERVLAAVLAKTTPPRGPVFPRFARWTVIGLACVGALFVGTRLWMHDPPTTHAPDPIATPPPIVEAPAMTIAPVITAQTMPTPSVSATTAHVAIKPPAPAPSDSVDTASMLQEESALIAKARGELRAGDATSALVTLDEAKTKFPNGVLSQERQALAIEATLRSGRVDEAKAMTDAFDARYPSSPHTARLRRMLTP
jgi:Outer membrane lipoprotein